MRRDIDRSRWKFSRENEERGHRDRRNIRPHTDTGPLPERHPRFLRENELQQKFSGKLSLSLSDECVSQIYPKMFPFIPPQSVQRSWLTSTC